MGFNRKDLEDDDDFNFDDDNSSFDFGDEAGGDDFKFDDEPANIGLDDDAGFGFEEEDMPDIDEDEEAGGGGGGVSRTFIIIAAVMIILFILGLGAVVLISQGGGPSDFDQTRVAIENQNATTAANALLTETAKADIALTQTAIALTPSVTPTLAPTDTPTIPTVTPTPTEDATQTFANALLTQQASELTQTAEFTPQITPTAQVGPNEVALTATELARILSPNNQPTAIAGAPTQYILTPVGPLPTQLPQTGFFDDLAAGNANVGLIALMALGLVGVIVVSRRVRAATK